MFNQKKKSTKPCFFCFVFSFLYNSKIALGSRRNMTQRQTFPLKTQLPSLSSLEKFQPHISLSKGFIWGCPIGRKTSSKSLWPLQQTSWVRQVRHRVQDFALLGCYCIQESRMWDLPWPLKQEAGTLQGDILHTQSPAQAVSAGSLGLPGRAEPCWVRLPSSRHSQAPPEMREGRSTMVQTSPAGGEHPPGVQKQLQTEPLKEKTQSTGFWNRIWDFKVERVQEFLIDLVWGEEIFWQEGLSHFWIITRISSTTNDDIWDLNDVELLEALSVLELRWRQG